MSPGQPHSSADQVVAERIVKRRPKNRKSTIATVAAEAFGALGYHAVSMEDIAAKVDVSAAALYRHYPSKYALFRDAVLTLGAQLRAAATLPAEAAGRSADQRVDWLLQSILSLTINNRQSGALYRWEGRYLDAPDQARLREQVDGVHSALAAPLGELRPELSTEDLAMLCAAALAIMGSITDHRATLPPKALRKLLSDTCWTVLRSNLPSITDARAPAKPAAEIPESFKHELLLEKAIVLFHQRGYPEVGIDDIATAAGLPPSGVYRYYRSKADLLTAAFRRAADRVSAAIPVAVTQSSDSREALTRLVDLYVTSAFAQSELTFVYYSEIGNVPSQERSTLRNIQRLNVQEWARLLTETRPELSARQARFLIHAALGLVVDLGRLLHFDKSPSSEGRVQYLMLRVLFGEQA